MNRKVITVLNSGVMITLGVLRSITCHAGPATPPAEEPLTWGQEPIEARTSRRATICLNGIWQAMPAMADARQQPTDDWGYIRVPGNWQENLGRIPGWVAAGTGAAWQDFRERQVSRLWYQRPIRIPADWVGRAIILEFERLSTDARIFVNDRDCGEVHWPEGTVDITQAIAPGQEATVRLLAVATPDASAVKSLLSGDEPGPAAEPLAETTSGGRGRRGGLGSLPARGLTGDVLLHRRSQVLSQWERVPDAPGHGPSQGTSGGRGSGGSY